MSIWIMSKLQLHVFITVLVLEVHGIPEDVIRKRYARSIENLSVIKDLVDEYYIWDNSGENFVLLEKKKESNN